VKLGFGVVAALVCVAACGSPADLGQLGSSIKGQATVRGQVTMETCPSQAGGGVRCAALPAAGVTVRFRPEAGGTTATAATDQQGAYEIRLAPARYLVAAGDSCPAVAVTCGAIRVDLKAGDTTRLDLSTGSVVRIQPLR
jgi:hypothetical protein